jgi:hypothetical protein
VPYLIDLILEGIVDGRQGERLKTIVPQTDLNMVRHHGGWEQTESFLKMTPHWLLRAAQMPHG